MRTRDSNANFVRGGAAGAARVIDVVLRVGLPMLPSPSKTLPNDAVFSSRGRLFWGGGNICWTLDDSDSLCLSPRPSVYELISITFILFAIVIASSCCILIYYDSFMMFLLFIV